MDWDFKVPPGDSSGLDRDAEPSLSSVAFEPSGRGPRRHPRAPYCSVDLALGGLGDSKDRSKVSTPTMASSLSASRRPPLRPPGSGSTKVACSVDGCGADLSSCKQYHRRHKVCEAHSKTPVVVVGGQEQRFCQQCSRFHSLVEFDEVKRSCRKRLDGHNRRRRKPPPDSIDLGRSFVNNRGIIFSAHPPICSTTTRGQPNRPGTVETGDNFLHAHCLPPHSTSRNQGNPSIHSYRRVKNQFPFLQEEDTTFIRNTMVGIPVCSPHLRTFMPPTSSSSSSSKVFSNGSTEVFDSDCALSLLSPPTKASGTNFVQLFRDPLGLSLRDYDKLVPASFSCSGVEDKHMMGRSFPVSDGNDSDVHFQTGVHDGTSRSLHFCWH